MCAFPLCNGQRSRSKINRFQPASEESFSAREKGNLYRIKSSALPENGVCCYRHLPATDSVGDPRYPRYTMTDSEVDANQAVPFFFSVAQRAVQYEVEARAI